MHVRAVRGQKKKPRMVRGSELLKTRVSELEKFVLAETESAIKGFESISNHLIL